MALDRSSLAKTLGPGLVWAAAAVGVSHLVQSTRAGAGWGAALVPIVLLVVVLKYPFFEFGPRYAAATGESLVEGYHRLGRWAVWLYLGLTVGTMFAVLAAIALVTGSIATQLFPGSLSPVGWSAVLMAGSGVVLSAGRYPLLDALVKAIMVVLTLSTVAAVAAAAIRGPAVEPGFVAPEVFAAASFPFLIALAGWMPSAVDISVWHSLWTLERAKQTGHRPRLPEVLFDFRLGYVGTVALSLFFLALGALVLYGSGDALAEGGAAFAAQVVDLYVASLGTWSRPIIALAAFTTMFSTTLTVIDAFPRVLARVVRVLAGARAGTAAPDHHSNRLYWIWMLVLVAGSLLVVGVFTARLTLLVDFATTLSFLTAPVLSWLNLRAVTAPHVPAEARPSRRLLALAWVGLAFGALFAAVFLVWRFF